MEMSNFECTQLILLLSFKLGVSNEYDRWLHVSLIWSKTGLIQIGLCDEKETAKWSQIKMSQSLYVIYI